MTVVNEDLQIVSVGDLLKTNLFIPNYQRPYKWSAESATTLFYDVCSAWKSDVPEYRMGSVILHKNGSEFAIVDGQQRVTTLSILTYCFYKLLGNQDYVSQVSLLNKRNLFDALSSKSIVENYELLRHHCETIKELKGLASYILGNCTFVKIVTNTEQEAFQFFDSQNSRGKPLEPHDLLKSYHLREMAESPEKEKVDIINAWENEDQRELASFFKDNLYPLVQWYGNKNGLYYSINKIKAFKGIGTNSNYNYSVYHKAANLYIEHFNSDGLYELTNAKKIHQFQLTQPVIAGKRFFLYVLHYFCLRKEITRKIESAFEKRLIPTDGSGNIYTRNLLVNVAMFFVDKFNMEELSNFRLRFLYRWAYSLRLVMHSVYPETINRYALGYPDSRINSGLNIFSRISEMQTPHELDCIVLDRIQKEDLESYKTTKYNHIWDSIFGGGDL